MVVTTGNRLGAFRPDHSFEAIQWLFQDTFVQEQDRGQRLILSRRGNMALDRRVRQEPDEVGLGHFTGMPVAVEFEIPTNRVKIGLQCAPGVVVNSQDFDNAFVQTRGRMPGKEAEWDAKLWECDGHGE